MVLLWESLITEPSFLPTRPPTSPNPVTVPSTRQLLIRELPEFNPTSPPTILLPATATLVRTTLDIAAPEVSPNNPTLSSKVSEMVRLLIIYPCPS